MDGIAHFDRRCFLRHCLFFFTPLTFEVMVLRRKVGKSPQGKGITGRYPVSSMMQRFGLVSFPSKLAHESNQDVVREPMVSPPQPCPETCQCFVIACVLHYLTHMSAAYAVIYITLTAFMISCGWSQIDGSLPFIGIVISVIMSCLAIALHTIYYLSQRLQQTEVHLQERRLPPTIAGSATGYRLGRGF